LRRNRRYLAARWRGAIPSGRSATGSWEWRKTWPGRELRLAAGVSTFAVGGGLEPARGFSPAMASYARPPAIPSPREPFFVLIEGPVEHADLGNISPSAAGNAVPDRWRTCTHKASNRSACAGKYHAKSAGWGCSTSNANAAPSMWSRVAIACFSCNVALFAAVMTVHRQIRQITVNRKILTLLERVFGACRLPKLDPCRLPRADARPSDSAWHWCLR